jgi:uncharacterized protein (TIGR02453 family)
MPETYFAPAAFRFLGELRASASVPGFYLHVQPGESFLAAGIWHPDPKALGQVRYAIARGSAEWKALKKTKLPIQGGTLQRPPRGYAPDHPDIEFLKHTDFTTSVRLIDKELGSADFPATFIKHCKTMAPLVKFVARAMDLPW